MAFDGITVHALTKELSDIFTGSRINKIYQPENEELLITLRTPQGNKKLLISANASLPLVYITDESGDNPLTAPNFCMLLRKHIGGGKIVNVVQPGNERIIRFEIEHLNEMGDLCRKVLIAELMGKHSNIIFCDNDDNIIDSIKHISANISSVREILPGRKYFVPNTMNKLDPFSLDRESFIAAVTASSEPVPKAIYTTITGISPLIAEEICYRAGIESRKSPSDLCVNELVHLFGIFSRMFEDINSGKISPAIYYDGEAPKEFSIVPITSFESYRKTEFHSVSDLLQRWFFAKANYVRNRQRSADLRHITTTALEKARKKYDLQLRRLKDTESRDKYRIYGELLNIYGYNAPDGARKLECENYYDNNKQIFIPLDPDLSAKDNSIKYFEKYNKLKRTYEALSNLIITTENEMLHLESILNSLDFVRTESDLSEIRKELSEFGYIKKRVQNKNIKRSASVSKPLHYISSDGFDIYVGKNNYQNDEVTFKIASPNDWWFHAKGTPGSHVIVKGKVEELPDNTFNEAGRLAAFYSKGRAQGKVEIDYIQRKFIRKTPGGAPGFVIYHTNYSMMAEPNIDMIKEVK